jgi:hypothetical protein
MNAPERVIELPKESYSRREDGDKAATGSAVAIQPGAGSLLQAMTQAVSLNHVDMDKVERLFAMHQTILAQEAKAAFNDAMARAQSLIQPIVRNKENTHTRSWYSDLAAINEQIVPIYTAEGLAVSFDTETKNDADPIAPGDYRTIAIVTHRQGHERRYHIDLALDDAGSQGNKNKTRVQAKGSTTSFGRRYLVLMIFNVSTEDDDDGNGGKKKEPAGSNKPESSTPEPKKDGVPPAYPADQFSKNLPTWLQLIKDGKKTAAEIMATVQSRYLLSGEQMAQIRGDAKGVQP